MRKENRAQGKEKTDQKPEEEGERKGRQGSRGTISPQVVHTTGQHEACGPQDNLACIWFSVSSVLTLARVSVGYRTVLSRIRVIPSRVTMVWGLGCPCFGINFLEA